MANIAWVISPNRQGQEMPSEATPATSCWLQSKGVHSFLHTPIPLITGLQDACGGASHPSQYAHIMEYFCSKYGHID
ncbi:hypothetical protein [Arthrobacter sp. GMC3]|uniref:hypothetical protein n=1 Tax=Arthrobacter sp. GMC3 TaxID=2058894 RepID=UPI0011B00C23|nr:hypothetical protein [Arthrobacter sp. GMC3]